MHFPEFGDDISKNGSATTNFTKFACETTPLSEHILKFRYVYCIRELIDHPSLFLRSELDDFTYLEKRHVTAVFIIEPDRPRPKGAYTVA
jgi:hypothetical protein